MQTSINKLSRCYTKIRKEVEFILSESSGYNLFKFDVAYTKSRLKLSSKLVSSFRSWSVERLVMTNDNSDEAV